MPEQSALSVASRVESLLDAKKRGCRPSADDNNWLDRIGVSLHARLVKLGLTWAGVRNDRDGFVYFIQSGSDGAIKIGFSSKVDIRLGSLQKANAETLRLLATIPGTMADEARLHQRFAAHRIRGEWFRPAEELLLAIKELQKSGKN